jgi:hypothetical protein
VIQGPFGVIQGTFGVIQETYGVIQGTFGVIQVDFDFAASVVRETWELVQEATGKDDKVCCKSFAKVKLNCNSQM